MPAARAGVEGLHLVLDTIAQPPPSLLWTESAPEDELIHFLYRGTFTRISFISAKIFFKALYIMEF